ncbi:MAG: ABC transporter permease [Candidatus Goldbacteria bacterium]|nr:ABC transporter permease [Candidatus Goldiibacteriota bacterium]
MKGQGRLDIKRVIPVMRKEFLQIKRDPRSLGIALLAPVVLLILYGYAVTFDIKNINISVVDYDNTAYSRQYVSKIEASGYFTLYEPARNDMKKSVEALRINKVRAILSVPKGFSSDLKNNKKTSVQLICDGSEPNTSTVAIGYVSAVTMMYSRGIILEKVKMRGVNPKNIPAVMAEPRVWYNPQMKSVNFIVPGLIAILMMLIAGTLTSLTVVREKERGTFEQLISTPVKPLELMAGKLFPYVIIGFVDVIIVAVVGMLWFKVPFRGDIIAFLLMSVMFIFTAMGMGMLISSVAPNQTVAVIGTVMATMLPSILLSGFVFPVASMPKIIQVISYVVPAKYFLTALRSLFLKPGVGFNVLYPEALLLLVFGLFFVAASAKRFRKYM